MSSSSIQMPREFSLLSRRFGKLIVTGIAGRDAKGEVSWQCACDCGTTGFTAKHKALLDGVTTHCSSSICTAVKSQTSRATSAATTVAPPVPARTRDAVNHKQAMPSVRESARQFQRQCPDFRPTQPNLDQMNEFCVKNELDRRDFQNLIFAFKSLCEAGLIQN